MYYNLRIEMVMKLSNLISRIIKFYNEKRVIKTIKFMRHLFVSLSN